MSIAQALQAKLGAEFSPIVLEIKDLSYLHQGHVGSHPEGETHFKILIVSKSFIGKSRLERHQLVYEILQEEIKQVHALQLVLKSPEECPRS